MKNFLLCICITCPFILVGQIKSSISTIIGVDYSYRVLQNTSNESVVKAIYTARQNREIGKLNYRIGFNYNRKISEKLWSESGFRLASIGYKDKKLTDFRWASEYDPNTGTWQPDPTLPHESQLKYDNLFLEVPIGFRYVLGNHKLKPYVTFGLSTNIYLITRTKYVTDIGSQTRSGNSHFFRRINFSANIGVGFEYAVSENYQIFTQPSFRYYFTKLANAPIKEFLYNFGVEVGLRKKLK